MLIIPIKDGENIDKALKGVELTTSLKTSKAQEAEAEDLPIMIIYGKQIMLVRSIF